MESTTAFQKKKKFRYEYYLRKNTTRTDKGKVSGKMAMMSILSTKKKGSKKSSSWACNYITFEAERPVRPVQEAVLGPFG